MVYIPTDRKITVAPDFTDLPTTMRFPRDTRSARTVLIASGIWFIFAAGLAVAMFVLFPGLSHAMVASLLGAVTLFAFLAGIAALRQYASEDEVSLDKTGIKTRKVGWIKTSERFYRWDEIDHLQEDSGALGYFTLAMITGKNESLPTLLARNKALVDDTKTKLQRFLTK
jgi:hypothetical protein